MRSVKTAEHEQQLLRCGGTPYLRLAAGSSTGGLDDLAGRATCAFSLLARVRGRSWAMLLPQRCPLMSAMLSYCDESMFVLWHVLHLYWVNAQSGGCVL
jgi:hypothetical protein